MKVLIAEDEIAMRKIIKLYFLKECFEVETAENGQIAFDMICERKFDLIVIDWMMPVKSGIQLCKDIRQLKIPVKIILLTAKCTTDDEFIGLKSGADDYIRKPFEPSILILRAKKLLQIEEIISCGEITMNLTAHKAEKNGIELNLSKKEYDLLEVFLKNQSIVLTRDILLEGVWGIDYEGDIRTVDTHIKRLRSKIGNEFIVTFRGLGYCMEKKYE